MQPLLTRNMFLNQISDPTINTISYDLSNNRMILGGDFFGYTLAQYNPFTNSIGSIAELNNQVFASAHYYSTVFFGGAFTMNQMINRINRLGRMTPFLSLNENDATAPVQLFPNPFHDRIEIQGLDAPTSYQILDLKGKTVDRGTFQGGTTIDLPDLQSGVYLMRFEAEDRIFTKKIVKQ